MLIVWDEPCAKEEFIDVCRKIFEQYSFITAYHGGIKIEVEHDYTVYNLYDVRTCKELYISITPELDLSEYLDNCVCTTMDKFRNIIPILTYCDEWEPDNKKAFLSYLSRKYGVNSIGQENVRKNSNYDENKCSAVVQEMQQINERVLRLQNEIYKEKKD